MGVKILKITEVLAEQAIRKSIIEVEQKEIFCYGIEKRLTSLLVGIPCFLFAVLVSDFWGAFVFNMSFFFIRKYSNGFHASTILMCLLSSLFCEFLFLGIIYPLLTPTFVLFIMSFSVPIIILLAPYNHPAFNYSPKELISCKKYVFIWLAILSVFALVGLVLSITALSKGISLGCAMAGFSLCFAYLIDWRKSHENKQNKTGHHSQQSCKNNDGLWYLAMAAPVFIFFLSAYPSSTDENRIKWHWRKAKWEGILSLRVLPQNNLYVC